MLGGPCQTLLPEMCLLSSFRVPWSRLLFFLRLKVLNQAWAE